MKLTLQNGKLVSQDGIEVENPGFILARHRSNWFMFTDEFGIIKKVKEGEEIALPDSIAWEKVDQFKANGHWFNFNDNKQVSQGDTEMLQNSGRVRQVIRLKPVEKTIEKGAGDDYPITEYAYRKVDAVEHKTQDAALTIVKRYERGMSEYFRMHDYRNMWGLFENLVNELESNQAPKWYSRGEIYDHLKRENYSETIANELSDKWSDQLQGAFNKGYEKGKISANTDTQESQEDKFLCAQSVHHDIADKAFKSGVREVLSIFEKEVKSLEQYRTHPERITLSYQSIIEKIKSITRKA
jgi:hypothetical protein